MIITIGRECGCNADEIGRMLAGKYGIFCYTKAELIQLAKEKGVYEKYPFFFGEMPVDMMISPMAESLEERLRNTPQEALESVLGGEDCVIVGRCANYILKDKALSLFIYAPFEARLKTVMERTGREEKSARKMIKKIDKDRRAYYEYFTDKKWKDISQYHLAFDSSKFEQDKIIQMIKMAL